MTGPKIFVPRFILPASGMCFGAALAALAIFFGTRRTS